MAMGIFEQLAWLTTKVKRLCCALDILKKEVDANKEANPCYLEITKTSGGSFPYATLSEYNANTDWDTPFTGLVIVGDSIQRLYGGSNVYLSNIFQGNPDITSINDGCGVVTGIGSAAFEQCTSLTYVNLPVITVIPFTAFYRCNLLSYFNAPLVTNIGDSAFEESGLGSIDFPLLTTAGNASFRNCSLVTSINLPLLQTIDQGCFTGLVNFAEVLNLPELLSAPQFSFNNMNNCLGYNFPKVQATGYGCFSDSCVSSSGDLTFNLKSCTDLGGTVGDDAVWGSLTSKIVTLTIPSVLMTCNSGAPDGDIQYLQLNNTVTIIIV
jgi:hypothetical protein